MALHQAGKLAEAEAVYREVLAREPDHFQALHFFGVLEAQRGRLVEAESLIARSLKINSQVADAFMNHARILHGLGRTDEAVRSCDRALAINPRHLGTLVIRANALRALGRHEDALTALDQALALNPQNPVALAARGDVLRQLRRSADALTCYDRAIALNASYLEAWCNRAAALQDLGRHDEALASCDRALALKPDHPQTLVNRGAVLHDRKRHDEALAAYRRALSAAPQHAEALYNSGVTLQALKRPDEALTCYQQALAVDPNNADAHWNEAFVRLLRGDYASGLPKYEWRWRRSDQTTEPPAIRAPQWQGEPLAGRSIVVFCEQGLGDIIQFGRYLPLLVERGARVTFLCPRKMIRLLQPLTAAIMVTDTHDPNAEYDFQCALLSLPYRFGTELASIPNTIPYLRAEDSLVAQWRERIGTNGFKIGISWQGNVQGRADTEKSIALETFAPLARLPGVRLISLQKGQGSDQLTRLPGVAENLGDAFDGGPDAFVDAAAVMSALDLIITVDTSIAHLAGALGRPTWVALRFVPDWRWLLERRDSPWYPNAVRLFRQPQPDDWDSVFAEIERELLARAT